MGYLLLGVGVVMCKRQGRVERIEATRIQLCVLNERIAADFNRVLNYTEEREEHPRSCYRPRSIAIPHSKTFQIDPYQPCISHLHVPHSETVM